MENQVTSPTPLSTETIAVIRREAVAKARKDFEIIGGTEDGSGPAIEFAMLAASYAIESCIREFAALTEGVLRARDRGTETKGEGM